MAVSYCWIDHGIVRISASKLPGARWPTSSWLVKLGMAGHRHGCVSGRAGDVAAVHAPPCAAGGPGPGPGPGPVHN